MTAAALLRLLAWLSPGFPTGGYAYSHGLEWAVEAGDVRDGAGLAAWIGDLLRHGSLRSDAILLRAAHAAGAGAALDAVIALAQSVCSCRERRLETVAQGEAFVAAARAWGCELPADGIAYPVAVGALTAAHGIPASDAVAAFLQAASASLVSAAVRLIPLGQQAGVRALAALEPGLLAAAAREEGVEALGTACFRAEIAAMRHETQETRLFRT